MATEVPTGYVNVLDWLIARELVRYQQAEDAELSKILSPLPRDNQHG